MALSKFLVISAFYWCIALHANPNTEFYELREMQRACRRESPRHTRPVCNPAPAEQTAERCCWGFLLCFADLMQYASNSSPYANMNRRPQ